MLVLLEQTASASGVSSYELCYAGKHIWRDYERDMLTDSGDDLDGQDIRLKLEQPS